MIKWHELAEIDDYLTRNLIDNLFFWIKTRKLNKGSQKPLNISALQIINLINKYIIHPQRPNIDKCIRHFIALPVTQEFLELYRGDQSIIQEFKKHTRKYIEMYLPDCGFELMTSDRYVEKSNSIEANVVARKEISSGEEIKYLTGTFSELTSEEEEDLDKSDFSVIHCTSRAYPCLMLGPTRFVNHDCDGNARFSSTKSGMRIFATRNILVGEEITVYYANSYFGKNNKGCLCATCERTLKGSFDPEKFTLPEDAHIIDISSSDDENGKSEMKTINGSKHTKVKPKVEEPDSEPEVIILDSEPEPEYYDLPETKANRESPERSASEEPSVEVDASSLSPVPIDSEEFDKTLKNSDRKRLSSIVSCMHSATDEPFEEPESENVGGRRLRPRGQLKKNLKIEDNILNIYSLDESLDSLLMDVPDLNDDVIRQRQINRTLHKLQSTQLYKIENKEYLYDCRHCGIYFQILPKSKYSFREFCHRCARHQLLYSLAWPETRKKQDSGFLVLDKSITRPPLSDVRPGHSNLMKREKISASHIDTIMAKSSRNSPGPSKISIKKKASTRKIPDSSRPQDVRNSDYFTNSSSDDDNRATPEILPLGGGGTSFSTGKSSKNKRKPNKSGIKKVASLKRIKEKMSEIFGEEKSEAGSRESGGANSSNGPNRIFKNNSSISKREGSSELPDRGDPSFRRSNREMPRHKFKIVKHHRHIFGRINDDGDSDNDSSNSLPSKEEMLNSRPKIRPSELRIEAAKEKGNRDLSSSTSNGKRSIPSEFDSIDETTFIKAKEKKINRGREPSRSSKKNIPADAIIVDLDTEEEIVPVKPFIPSPRKPKKKPVLRGRLGSKKSGIHVVSIPKARSSRDFK